MRHPPSVTTDYPEGVDGDFPEMTLTVLDRALVVGDAGRVTGERQEHPDPEVPEKARRRSFTFHRAVQAGRGSRV